MLDMVDINRGGSVAFATPTERRRRDGLQVNGKSSVNACAEKKE